MKRKDVVNLFDRTFFILNSKNYNYNYNLFKKLLFEIFGEKIYKLNWSSRKNFFNNMKKENFYFFDKETRDWTYSTESTTYFPEVANFENFIKNEIFYYTKMIDSLYIFFLSEKIYEYKLFAPEWKLLKTKTFNQNKIKKINFKRIRV